MKVQYASDIHLEFKSNSDYIKEHPLECIGDYLVLAGDITYYGNEYFKNPFFDKVSKCFEQVYIVPGNHEYYNGYDIANHEDSFRESIRENVHFVNNVIEPVGDVDFIFSTLWSKLEQKHKATIVRGLRDFYWLIRNGERFAVSDYEYIHCKSLSFLQKAISESKAEKKVVVTHHIPSLKCNAIEFVGSSLNSAFVNSLDDLIENSDVDYWVYGHHHRNIPVVEVGKTKLLTNQLGYVDIEEHDKFRTNAYFEV